jgi:hypothetical protein
MTLKTSDIKAQIDRLLTNHDSLRRQQLLAELPAYDEGMVGRVLDSLVLTKFIAVEEDAQGMRYKKQEVRRVNILKCGSLRSRRI